MTILGWVLLLTHAVGRLPGRGGGLQFVILLRERRRTTDKHFCSKCMNINAKDDGNYGQTNREWSHLLGRHFLWPHTLQIMENSWNPSSASSAERQKAKTTPANESIYMINVKISKISQSPFPLGIRCITLSIAKQSSNVIWGAADFHLTSIVMGIARDDYY